MAEGGQLLRLSDDTVFDRAAVLSLARLGAGRLFGDDPIAEGVGLAAGGIDALRVDTVVEEPRYAVLYELHEAQLRCRRVRLW